jgi:hypothetical protein
MESEPGPRRPETFVVRLAGDATTPLAGLIHHVRTGEKRRFEGLEGLGMAIQEMAGDAAAARDADEDMR